MSVAVSDMIYVSPDAEFTKRCQSICEAFEFESFHFASMDDLADDFEKVQSAKILMFDLRAVDSFAEVIATIELSKQLQQDSFIIPVVDKKIPAADVSKLEDMGISTILNAEDIFNTSKLEFIVSQKIRSLLIPIKAHELMPDVPIPFTVLHAMPMNRKFLPVIREGQEITPRKYEKIQEVNELFIQRHDVVKFKEYASTVLTSQEGLLTQCRSQFLHFSVIFTDLAMTIVSSQGEVSFDTGKALFAKCEELAEQLIENLSQAEDPWSVVNNSSFGDFGSVERSPSLAAYTGIIAKHAGLGDQKKAMIGALIADIGLLELTPSITHKMRSRNMDDLSTEELEEYHMHPIKSVNACLARKLPLPEDLRQIVMCSHEKMDQQGFPNKPRADQIPIEGQIVQFSELLDKETMIEMGRERLPFLDRSRHLFQTEYNAGDRFSMLFLEKIRKVVAPKRKKVAA